jgi:hypothetical protein
MLNVLLSYIDSTQLVLVFAGGANLVSVPERNDYPNESVQCDRTHATRDSRFWSRTSRRISLLPGVILACGD